LSFGICTPDIDTRCPDSDLGANLRERLLFSWVKSLFALSGNGAYNDEWAIIRSPSLREKFDVLMAWRFTVVTRGGDYNNIVIK